MDFDHLHTLWDAYRQRDVSRVVHPDDHMFNSARQPSDYFYVGESAAIALASALALAPTHKVKSALDFGSGHGRVARHLRALLPEARLTFVDPKPGSADFCAEQFGGETAESQGDFATLDLPTDFDLIWAGSIFTHIDSRRMGELFRALFRSLAPNGVLVATFHGRRVIETKQLESSLTPEQWAALMEMYVRFGVGHQPYDTSWGTPEGWGLSLTKPERVLALAEQTPEARLVAFMAAAWAKFHDVCAWTRDR
jgi:SAM-dependent methyltransferase